MVTLTNFGMHCLAGPDRMVRDANGKDEDLEMGFEDLEEFFTKQKKRAIEERRRDRNQA